MIEQFQEDNIPVDKLFTLVKDGPIKVWALADFHVLWCNREFATKSTFDSYFDKWIFFLRIL